MDGHQTLEANVLTPTGRGAVATIRITDQPEALAAAVDRRFQPANGKSLLAQPINRICFGHWITNTAITQLSQSNPVGGSDDTSTNVNAEEVVLCRISPSELEVNCHGGQAAIDRILLSLSTLANPLTHTVDALTSSTEKSFINAECLSKLTHATTARTVKFILRQLPNQLERFLVSLIENIEQLQSVAGCEDQSDETTETFESCRSQIDGVLNWSEFGKHLTEPWRVVLVGSPNVGKSTLINTLLGFERAIVFDEPGTTRDVVVGDTAFDGWPVRIVDTAGIRHTDNELESQGIAKSRQEIVDADCVCILLDVSNDLSTQELELLQNTVEIVGSEKLVIVQSKSDLKARWDLESIPMPLRNRCVQVSTLNHQRIVDLINRIVDVIVPVTPSDDDVIPLSDRHVTSLKQARSRLGSLKELAAARQALQQCLNPDNPPAVER